MGCWSPRRLWICESCIFGTGKTWWSIWVERYYQISGIFGPLISMFFRSWLFGSEERSEDNFGLRCFLENFFLMKLHYFRTSQRRKNEDFVRSRAFFALFANLKLIGTKMFKFLAPGPTKTRLFKAMLACKPWKMEVRKPTKFLDPTRRVAPL